MRTSRDILTVAKLLADLRGFAPPAGLRVVAGTGWATAVRDARQIVEALSAAAPPRTKRDFRDAPVTLGVAPGSRKSL